VSAFGSERTLRCAVASWGSTTVGRHPGRTPTELGFEALHNALARIDLSASELDGLFIVPQGYARAQAPLRPSRVTEELGLSTRALIEVECGGASSLLAFKAACQEIATGQIEVAAVIGAQSERRLYEDGMDEGDLDRVYLLASMMGSYVAPYGVLTAVSCYALSAQRYMHEHGIAAEEIAELPVRLRRHAALNPIAEQREPLSVEDVLSSRMVCPPVHKLEAPPWSDGGACVIVASEDWARRRGLEPVFLTGWGEAHDSANFVAFEQGLTSFPWVRDSTNIALERAGRRLDDLDVAEIYGAFAASELMTYEAVGFFRDGEAAAAVARDSVRPPGSADLVERPGRDSAAAAARTEDSRGRSTSDSSGRTRFAICSKCRSA